RSSRSAPAARPGSSSGRASSGDSSAVTTTVQPRRWWRAALAAPPVAFLLVFFVWPVAAILLKGLRPGGTWDLSAVGDVLTDPVIRRVAWFTLWQAVLSTVLCVVAGLPGAALFARFRFPGKRFVWAALLVPFVLPTVVVGVA